MRDTDFAKKLLSLAERGDPGERENARRKLDEFCARNGISIESLEQEEIHSWVLKYNKSTERIMRQCVAMVLNTYSPALFGHKRRRSCAIIDCTEQQFVEIMFTYEHYHRLYESELKVFTKAFIYSNDLFPKVPGATSHTMPDSDTLRAMGMASSIKSETPLKRIGDSK